MEDKEDGCDRVWRHGLESCLGIILLPVSCLGWLWVYAWYFKEGYRELAMSAGFGAITPFLAWACAVVPLIILSVVSGKLKEP